MSIEGSFTCEWKKHFWNSLGAKCSRTLKKSKIEGRTTYILNTYSSDILILSPQRLFNAAKAVSSTGFSKKTGLKSSTSVAHFLPKNNKVHVKLEVAYQGCFSTLFRGISRTPARSKMDLFVILRNGFHPLTNVTKNPILDVVGVVGRIFWNNILYTPIETDLVRLYCCVEKYCSKILISNVLQTEWVTDTAPEKRFG